MSDEREMLAEVLARTLLNEGGGAGSSLHSWRCEYPDRYGECSCVEETAEEQAAVLLASPQFARLIAAAKAEAWDEAASEFHGLGWLHDWALSDGLARNPYRAALTAEPAPEATT